jgi:carboxypeptidase family protein
MKRLLLALAVAALLSGCTQSTTSKANTSSAGDIERPALEGWIMDPSQLALAGVQLRIEAANASATSGPDGHYAFAALPTDAPLVVVAEAPGYKPLSKSVTLAPETSLLLNFTLEPVPVKVPRVDMVPKKGLIACQAAVVLMGDEQRYDCGGNDPNNAPRVEFTVGPDTAGVVLELVWEPSTAAADNLNLTVETVGLGDQDQVLASTVGQSVLRAQINSFQAARFYSQGGTVRATVMAGTNPDEEESTAGASVPFQQAFDLYVSVFYVEGPSPTYTALK